jgi:uncharacterized membrane protein
MPVSEALVFVATLLAALGSALVGGVLLGFSDFIMKSLGRIAPAAGVAAMQEINVVVLRSWFLRTFFATALLSIALIVVALARWQTVARRSAWSTLQHVQPSEAPCTPANWSRHTSSGTSPRCGRRSGWRTSW